MKHYYRQIMEIIVSKMYMKINLAHLLMKVNQISKITSYLLMQVRSKMRSSLYLITLTNRMNRFQKISQLTSRDIIISKMTILISNLNNQMMKIQVKIISTHHLKHSLRNNRSNKITLSNKKFTKWMI